MFCRTLVRKQLLILYQGPKNFESAGDAGANTNLGVASVDGLTGALQADSDPRVASGKVGTHDSGRLSSGRPGVVGSNLPGTNIVSSSGLGANDDGLSTNAGAAVASFDSLRTGPGGATSGRVGTTHPNVVGLAAGNGVGLSGPVSNS